jgi:hypothetical protein
MHRPPFSPQENSWYSYLLEAGLNKIQDIKERKEGSREKHGKKEKQSTEGQRVPRTPIAHFPATGSRESRKAKKTP